MLAFRFGPILHETQFGPALAFQSAGGYFFGAL
jgi:hypothetical protein